MPRHKRINLWSGPRSISTALMYSFAQRSDTRVADEPLYGHYLAVTGAPHPGADEILAAMDNDGERVVREVILGSEDGAGEDRPVVFFKQMAHHLVEIDWSFMDGMLNVLLIRDPREMLPSLAHQLARPALSDTGLDRQVEVFERLSRAGAEPPVVDARELLLGPEAVLRKLCRRLDLPFEEAMLSWPAGPRPEDGVWARHWYHNLHRSTGFAPYRPKSEPFPEHLEPLLAECAPLYARLAAEALRAD